MRIFDMAARAAVLCAGAATFCAQYATAAGNVTSWSCDPLANASLAPGATWSKWLCSSPAIPEWGAAGPVVVNLVTADLSQPSLQLVPATASVASGSLQTLDAIVAADGRPIVAGINAGYFYRLDVATFFDGVCIGKNAADARQNVSAAEPNYGVGDGAIVSRGALLGSNCDCLGFNLPVFLTINGTASRIDMLGRAAAPPAGLALDSLAAGPNLVASNGSGAYIAVPSNDENFLNILEHSANTAFGLSLDGRTGYFVTTDGYDSCPPTNSSCGTNAYTLAYFMKGACAACGGSGSAR